MWQLSHPSENQETRWNPNSTQHASGVNCASQQSSCPEQHSRSVQSAVAAVASARDLGARWVGHGLTGQAHGQFPSVAWALTHPTEATTHATYTALKHHSH